MSAGRGIRAIVDTNVFVSGIIIKRGHPHAIVQAWLDDAFTLVTSRVLHGELMDVLQRPHLTKKYELDPKYVEAILSRLENEALVAASTVITPVEVRDSDDNEVIAMAIEGEADYIVTGDQDLLVLRDHPRLAPPYIITAREFVEILAAL